MITITVIHDSLRNGKFPVEKIEEIQGMTVSMEKIDTFKEKYSITVDTTIHTDPIQDIAVEIGMMIQSYIMLELYLKK